MEHSGRWGGAYSHYEGIWNTLEGGVEHIPIMKAWNTLEGGVEHIPIMKAWNTLEGGVEHIPIMEWNTLEGGVEHIPFLLELCNEAADTHVD